MTIADAIATRSFMSLSPISLSPDGEWVAYTITNPAKRRTHTDDALEYSRTGAPRAAEGAELWIERRRIDHLRVRQRHALANRCPAPPHRTGRNRRRQTISRHHCVRPLRETLESERPPRDHGPNVGHHDVEGRDRSLGTPMLDLAKTVLPGVNRAIELGIADPARLGIMGQSYGCVSTLMRIVQTTRFKAAECSSGFSSIIGIAGVIGFGATWADSGRGKMGATVWERRDRYIENSPYFYLDRVTTPLLLVMGASDRTVPPFLGDATFGALRQLGKRVEYVRYGGEEHQPMKYSAANLADWMNRVVRWFDTYLGTGSQVVSH